MVAQQGYGATTAEARQREAWAKYEGGDADGRGGSICGGPPAAMGQRMHGVKPRVEAVQVNACRIFFAFLGKGIFFFPSVDTTVSISRS